jgi:hypothetical protein
MPPCAARSKRSSDESASIRRSDGLRERALLARSGDSLSARPAASLHCSPIAFRRRSKSRTNSRCASSPAIFSSTFATSRNALRTALGGRLHLKRRRSQLRITPGLARKNAAPSASGAAMIGAAHRPTPPAQTRRVQFGRSGNASARKTRYSAESSRDRFRYRSGWHAQFPGI